MKFPHEPMATYLANKALRSSLIAAFLESPRLFKDYVDGMAQAPTAALLFGQVAHLTLLEPHRYSTDVIVKPEGMNFATIAGKAWRDDPAHAGKLILKADDFDALTLMHARMPKRIRSIFDLAEFETTFRSDLGWTQAQCRADIWIEGSASQRPLTANLKTIDSITNIDRAIPKYHYHLSAQWYRRVIALEGGESPASILIFVEKKAPYRWREVDLDPDYKAIADKAIDRALDGIKRCMDTNDWADPGDADPREIASPPAWLGDAEEDPTFPDDEDGESELASTSTKSCWPGT